VVASEELCDAGCAPVLCRESDGEGASLDFWVCVWVVEPLLDLRAFVWCPLMNIGAAVLKLYRRGT